MLNYYKNNQNNLILCNYLIMELKLTNYTNILNVLNVLNDLILEV